MRTVPPIMPRTSDIKHVTNPQIKPAETTSTITKIDNSVKTAVIRPNVQMKVFDS